MLLTENQSITNALARQNEHIGSHNRYLPPAFSGTVSWPVHADPERPADPTPWFYRRTHRWRCVSNRNVYSVPTPRAPLTRAGRHRTLCPITWKHSRNVHACAHVHQIVINTKQPYIYIKSCKYTDVWGVYIYRLRVLCVCVSVCVITVIKRVSHLIVLSELPLTTSLSLYCKQAMPLLWPFNVRTNSHVDVFHTFIVRSPDADTIYFSSKSTTFTAALWPTSTLRRVISVCDVMSQTAIERSLNKYINHLQTVITV